MPRIPLGQFPPQVTKSTLDGLMYNRKLRDIDDIKRHLWTLVEQGADPAVAIVAANVLRLNPDAWTHASQRLRRRNSTGHPDVWVKTRIYQLTDAANAFLLREPKTRETRRRLAQWGISPALGPRRPSST